MMRKYLAVAMLAAAVGMTGCASVPMAGRSDDAAAKQFAPVADKGTVYIYRDEIMGSAIKMPLLVDGISVGDTGPKTYLEVALPPGTHSVTSKTEKDVTISLDVQAGKTYFIWQEVKMGMWAARSQLHIVDEAKGKKGVLDCSMVRTSADAFRVSAEQARLVLPEAPANEKAKDAAAADGQQAAAPVADAAPVAGAVASPANDADSHGAAPAAATIIPGGPASLDPRVSVPMFRSAQDLASVHQCDRLIRVESVDGDHGRFFSTCPGAVARLEIDCTGAQCSEAGKTNM
jgi:hypothetical protein